MPGRQDQGGKPWDRASSQHLAAINGNGSGKQRGIPSRPPHMTRIEHPPVTPRVGRPQREAPRRKSWRRRLLFWGILFIVCGVLAWIIGYGAFNFFAATSSALGPATTATDFLTALQNQNYDQAYNDLDAVITVQTAPDDFKQQAQADDRCYGVVTNYSEVADSAVQNNAHSYTYSYTITRSKLPKPYTLKMTLQQGTYGDWKISSYGNNNDLGPGQPPCS
jgi:hypothetical protein